MDPPTPRDIAGNSDDDPSPTDDQLDYSPNHHDDADDDYDTKPGNQASATENNHQLPLISKCTLTWIGSNVLRS